MFFFTIEGKRYAQLWYEIIINKIQRERECDERKKEKKIIKGLKINYTNEDNGNNTRAKEKKSITGLLSLTHCKKAILCDTIRFFFLLPFFLSG